MTYKTHITAGILTGGFLIMHFPEFEVYNIAASFIGAIILDIDEPKSYIGRKIKILSHIIKFILDHRGLIHSIPGTFILSFIFYLIVNFYSLAYSLVLFFLVGCITHLILDLFSDDGVPLFYPFIKKRYSIKIFKTRGFLEKIFRYSLYLLGIYLFIGFNILEHFIVISKIKKYIH